MAEWRAADKADKHTAEDNANQAGVEAAVGGGMAAPVCWPRLSGKRAANGRRCGVKLQKILPTKNGRATQTHVIDSLPIITL